jgi:hypothetical protein
MLPFDCCQMRHGQLLVQAAAHGPHPDFTVNFDAARPEDQNFQ